MPPPLAVVHAPLPSDPSRGPLPFSDLKPESAKQLRKRSLHWVAKTETGCKSHEHHRNPLLGSGAQLGKLRGLLLPGRVHVAPQRKSARLLLQVSRPLSAHHLALRAGSLWLGCQWSVRPGISFWKCARLCVHRRPVEVCWVDVDPLTYKQLGGVAGGGREERAAKITRLVVLWSPDRCSDLELRFRCTCPWACPAPVEVP